MHAQQYRARKCRVKRSLTCLEMGEGKYKKLWWRPRQLKRRAVELADNEVTPPALPVTQEYIKPELDSNQVGHSPAIHIYETDGRKVPEPVEIGDPNIVYEMPAREEVASEMTDGNRVDTEGVGFIKGRGMGNLGDRMPRSAATSRQSSISSGWGSPRSMFSEIVRGGNGRGRGSFNEPSAATETDTMSSLSSGWGTTDRSLGSDNVSPASPVQIRRGAQRGPGNLR